MTGSGESWRDVQVKADGLLRLTREAGRNLSEAIGAARRGDCYGADRLLHKASQRSAIVEQWLVTFHSIMPEASKVGLAQYRLGTAARRTRKRVARLCGW